MVGGWVGNPFNNARLLDMYYCLLKERNLKETEGMDLIGEIQEDLIKESAKLANTLRKAMVLAHKIQSPELQEWARAELDGYPYDDKDKVPPYRRIDLPVQGEFRGPLGFKQTELQIPTSGLPEEIRDIVDTEVMLDGVSVLEGLIEESFQTGRPPVRPLPLEVTELLRGAR